MALIISVSGIRGTIGGKPGDNLTPVDIVRFTSAYATLLHQQGVARKVVIGRDGRISGPMVQQIVMQTLMSMGFDVIDLGLTTTPTVEIAVPAEQAGGGIIITASHNPKQWNALKLLDNKGEFLSAEAGQHVLSFAESAAFEYHQVESCGHHILAGDYLDEHIRQILKLPFLQIEAIRARKFHVAVDAINSTGAIAIPRLLDALGATCTVINQEVTGQFAHNPEPLPEHLSELLDCVKSGTYDLGIAVDPDVDRLALVDETGSWFGEEYTLVAAADFWLAHNPGPVVSNLSSSRALRDLAESYGQSYAAAAVGEVHVVHTMRATNAVIGGEGNGGVILPDLHYGRDALVGVAIILALLVERNTSLSVLRKKYPTYVMSKQKVPLTAQLSWETVIENVRHHYSQGRFDDRDGLKIDLPDAWIHLRKSNTEPIVRIYTEASTQQSADDLARKVIDLITMISSNSNSPIA
ncbi:MAG: phosphoglucosamine mutase [Saprospiraceae bacterium]|nr:phosphoglucosamine mutase [Saprospiraceae bacterium]